MYRKVVFSKEPTALKLESLDDAVFLQMKHKSRGFAIGGRRDQFGIYPGDLETSTLHRAYVSIQPITSNEYQLSTDQVKTGKIHSPTVQFSKEASIHTPCDCPNQMHFRVASANGVFSFGDGSSWFSIGSNGVQIHGDLTCRRMYQTEVSAIPPDTAATVPTSLLDGHGKIPMEYLPEKYTSSLLNQYGNAGVGIGTQTPVQKLHVEGGVYLRDRLGIGMPTPTAALHISAPTTTPALRLDVADGGRGLELWSSNHETPVVSMSGTDVKILPPVQMDALMTRHFIIPNQFYPEPHRIRLMTPTFIQAPLTIQSTLATEDARPLRILAPSVQCSAIVAPKWNIPLLPDDEPPTTVPPLNPGFKGTRLSLNNQTIEFHPDAWRKAYQEGDEVARLTMSMQDGVPQLHLTQVVAFLWESVQQLTQRVKELEEKQISVK
jgi:hypothetical protein